MIKDQAMKTITTTLVAICLSSTAFAQGYPVVDTGQTVAFGDYAGQDAHYAADAPSHRVDVDQGPRRKDDPCAGSQKCR